MTLLPAHLAKPQVEAADPGSDEMIEVGSGDDNGNLPARPIKDVDEVDPAHGSCPWLNKISSPYLRTYFVYHSFFSTTVSMKIRRRRKFLAIVSTLRVLSLQELHRSLGLGHTAFPP